MEIISEEGFRYDGRKPNELREVAIKSGYLNKCGYIDLQQGGTKVRSILYGPKEKGQYKENIKFKISFYDVARQESGKHEKKIDECETLLSELFKPIISISESNYLEINILIKQDDGSLISTLINSVTILLCYCGVQIKDMCISITSCFFKGISLLDLSNNEENIRIPSLVLGYFPHRKTIGLFQSTGKTDTDSIKKLYFENLKAIDTLFSVFSNFLKNIN
ncbi:ribonuclease [Hamiltosporidium magnivora]|uniref:Ribonuclease n=2 Tax=Hamiltosporidium magnivora TaxID=148818 RepID=A0A4Q9LHV1_9MICR|nr:ribonuclease [Hamiltosporidium magnivora]